MSRKKEKHLPRPGPDWVNAVQRRLLEWYDEHRRDLPWRRDRDPYRIWVSEIMLQQTRVDTVIPYYQRFMEKFPTLEDLAAADEEDVIKAWEGLGYYSRARNLHAAVKEVWKNHKGKVPDDPQTISKLKGVGPYTAGAILSIAYGRKVPAVDGNVMRVLSRWFALREDVAKVSTRKMMEELDRQVIPDHRPGDFNQALMELGALICTPVSPSCGSCPVREQCKARHLGIQEELPVKKKGKPPVPVRMVFGWIRQGRQILLERRPDEGLLAGMWSLPSAEWTRESPFPSEALDSLFSEQGVSVRWGPVLGELEHVFSHRRWRVTVVAGTVGQAFFVPTDRFRWAGEEELDEVAFPNVYRKALRLVRTGGEKTEERVVQGSLF